MLEDELRRVKDDQLKEKAKKVVERRQLEHGVLPVASKKHPAQVGRGVSLDNRALGPSERLDKDGEPLEIKIIKAKDIDNISEIPLNNVSIDEQRLLPERKGATTLKANPVLK